MHARSTPSCLAWLCRARALAPSEAMPTLVVWAKSLWPFRQPSAQLRERDLLVVPSVCRRAHHVICMNCRCVSVMLKRGAHVEGS